MATPDHTPHGRGYKTSLNYFHHANDYWSQSTDSCKAPAPPPAPVPPATCGKNVGGSFCLSSSPSMQGGGFTKHAQDCCAVCGQTEGCGGWAWGKTFHAASGNHSCNLHTEVVKKDNGNCTSACAGDAPPGTGAKWAYCIPPAIPIVDLWQTDPAAGFEGPAHGVNSSCYGGQSAGGQPDTCDGGPKGDHWWGGYEDSIFEQGVLNVVAAHDAATPLFLFWAPHIVHTPLQVPQAPRARERGP